MKHTLTFTEDELKFISDVLIEQPYKKVALLFNSINAQLRAAQAKSTEGLPTLTDVVQEPITHD